MSYIRFFFCIMTNNIIKCIDIISVFDYVLFAICFTCIPKFTLIKQLTRKKSLFIKKKSFYIHGFNSLHFRLLVSNYSTHSNSAKIVTENYFFFQTTPGIPSKMSCKCVQPALLFIRANDSYLWELRILHIVLVSYYII